MNNVLSDRQLKRLAEHKYSAECVSILDPYFQVFWRWLVEQLPLWLAPNTITVSGLAINVFTSLILMFYCPQAREEASIVAHLSVILPSVSLVRIFCGLLCIQFIEPTVVIALNMHIYQYNRFGFVHFLCLKHNFSTL